MQVYLLVLPPSAKAERCFTLFLLCWVFLQICTIENISHLSELRVLNLAGNHISRVENLQGLDSLTELNLQHNCISVVVRCLFSFFKSWTNKHYANIHSGSCKIPLTG